MSDAAFPPGHFYSPIVDPEELCEREETVWAERPVRGIEFDEAATDRILTEWFPRHIDAYDYPEHEDRSRPHRFYSRNSQFSWLDARLLFVILRELRPRRMIEVGSGFSSLLSADVNHRFLDGSMEFTCIEPYPREFLKSGISGLTRLVVSRVELLDVGEFGALESGDVLFIDSSHVSKTGSDLNFLAFEVLPRLAPGVLIHFHDIFLPSEYPREWVIEENRSWNEQYLVRALLMYSTAFRILFGSHHAFLTRPREVAAALGRSDGSPLSGGSLWLRRLESAAP